MTDPRPPSRNVQKLLAAGWEGVLHVFRRPLRSALTALTSAAAIAVTVNVISLTYGLDEDVRRDVAQFGRRTVDVGRLPILRPGAKREPLGTAEVARIRAALADLGAAVVPRRQVSGSARGEALLDRVQVVAAAPEYLQTLDIPLEAGRWLRVGDPGGRMGQGRCALDAEAGRKLFPGRTPAEILGKVFQLEMPGGARNVEIVGVLADPITYRALFESFDEGRGARTLTSSLLSFRNVYLPEDALVGGEYTGVSIALPTDEAVDVARQRLLEVWPQDASKGILGMLSGIGVFVRRDWMDALGGQTATGALLGNIIWIIIVGVAVIMISTLNLITIRERYDELAIRRCEGARRRDVAMQITVEGTLTSLIGGLVGLPLGFAGAALLRQIVDFPFRFELPYAIAATGVAILLGLFSSVIPARRAAKLQPARILSRRLT